MQFQQIGFCSTRRGWNRHALEIWPTAYSNFTQFFNNVPLTQLFAICLLQTAPWQGQRKRCHERPRAEQEVKDLPEEIIQKLKKAKLLPDSWEVVENPKGFDSILPKAFKPDACKAAAQVFLATASASPMEAAQVRYLDTATVPTHHPHKVLPLLKATSQIMMSKQDGMRFLLNAEILTALGYSRDHVMTSFLTDRVRGQMMVA